MPGIFAQMFSLERICNREYNLGIGFQLKVDNLDPGNGRRLDFNRRNLGK